MEELAQVYSRALFQAARDRHRLDEVREQLGQFADALDKNRELAVFFFSPYFSTAEKQQSLGTLLDGADEVFLNFLSLPHGQGRSARPFRAQAFQEFRAITKHGCYRRA